MKPLDHGVLNIPGRLNTIDRDLDRYKAEKAAEKRAAAKAATAKLKAERKEAKAVLEAMTTARLEQMAARLKLTVAQCRAELKSLAYFNPSALIAGERNAAKKWGAQ